MLKELFCDPSNTYLQPEESEQYQHWKLRVLQSIPNLNYDKIIELALHLSFESKVNDKQIWE